MAESAGLAGARGAVREYQELMAAVGRMVVGAAAVRLPGDRGRLESGHKVTAPPPRSRPPQCSSAAEPAVLRDDKASPSEGGIGGSPEPRTGGRSEPVAGYLPDRAAGHIAGRGDHVASAAGRPAREGRRRRAWPPRAR